MIPFSKPTIIGNERKYIESAIQSGLLSGDGPFTDKCQHWFEEHLRCKKNLLTPSCTAALEMAAILIDIQPGDEVIMPSYTFVSTANAFVLRGAKIVFVDIRADTMNIDESLIEAAISEKTKAIVPVHYAGVACEMDSIMEIAGRFNLYVVEDAAQGMMATYKGRPLGTIGHIGAYSFHATKNYTSGGEGGLLMINDERFVERAEIVREKGTNRSQFLNGAVDKYTWVDVGGSHLPSELQAAYLFSQLENAKEINDLRLKLWKLYYSQLKELEYADFIELPEIPETVSHNAHIFFLKVKEPKVADRLIAHLKDYQVQATTHYVPLHSSPFGRLSSSVVNNLRVTDFQSQVIVRLPMYHGLSEKEVIEVCSMIKKFFGS
ncbi:dTDP-4-amino-4,6-dideoxygalactose transaminase [Vibrio tubiashii]|uniref:dTDP-4-amino-4,6-dideoxygalactose transaminase n=1 Tax=Vibrio tubiashii TaxID=29498 RepID=UPI001EFC91C4|nr:dTDP-4-amino-4,6-dideoxygalactose transaminase [Vibrio tubiashii]MCG9584141.1 dTDP-4-amino-4,6-dideoxygalactose transaminase [Vibrio tubiashii]MCG9617736.1 dTDP-4-amino-4,6-dideoxygalactose transaminase [Vibrio tubiashii]MCG9689534.1 dTDP-4-amino-4,6-dideoxygalactose transaminase [Vibrio tubiashii]